MSNYSNFDNYYPFVLASNKVPKLDCLVCSSKKHWQRYININTGEILPDNYGRCDNSEKCGYWKNPYEDGYAKMIYGEEQKVTKVTKVALIGNKYFNPKPLTQSKYEPLFFNFKTYKKGIDTKRLDHNMFFQNLMKSVSYPFEKDEILEVFKLYSLGTVLNDSWKGSITFPFIDKEQRIRAVQVKKFDQDNHTKGQTYLHSILQQHCKQNCKSIPSWLDLYSKQEKKMTCLFGEQLLKKYPNKPVALVEAPKTAIYGWLYFNKSDIPIYKDFIWIAVGAKDYLNFEKIQVLKGRDVFVMPDLSKDGNTFTKWEKKVKGYEKQMTETRFIMDSLLELKATNEQKENGADIADVLIELDWREFRSKKRDEIKFTPIKTENKNIILSKASNKNIPSPTKTENNSTINILSTYSQKENWRKELAELESFFEQISIPTHPIKFDSCSTIKDPRKFINSHLQFVKNSSKSSPYYERLILLKNILLNLVDKH